MISSCSAWIVATMSSISPVRARSSSANRASPPRRRVGAGVVLAAGEHVVGHGDDGAAVHHDLAPTGQAEGVLGAGPVEGDGDGRPPVDDDRVGPVVLHVAPADVPGRARPPRRCGRRAVGVGCRPGATPAARGRRRSRDPGSRRRSGPEETLRPLPHGGERLQGEVQVSLFRRELGVGRGRRSAHRAALHANPAKAGRAKVPGHAGDTTPLLLGSNKPLSWDFALLIRPDFEPLPKGP